MGQLLEIKVPDIGDFKDVPVIEVHVKPGDTLAKEAPVVTLESDKATMEVPTSAAGVVKELKVKVGDTVSEGTVLLLLEAAADERMKDEGGRTVERMKDEGGRMNENPSSAAPIHPSNAADIHAEVLVLGGGPGGYTAAFRAADLGKKVLLVERHDRLGGVCLNVGCIPSKALLHAAKVITEAEEMAGHGVSFGKPEIDLNKLRQWKDEAVVAKLTKGLMQLAKQRKVTVLQGLGTFTSSHTLKVEGPDGTKTVSFDQAIIAAGSQATKIPGFPHDDPRVMDSTGALALADIPKRLLVIGGGIIGLEMACVYDALGSKITVVELSDGLIPGADRDLVRPLELRVKKRYEKILLGTKVTKLEALPEGIRASFEGPKAGEPQVFDRVLVAVGRRPNGKLIGAEAAGVQVNDQGFIPVDRQQRTNVPHLFAIGDIVGQPMLAHKAVHEGKVAAEVAAGHKAAFDARAIPSVAYTDPEVAWMGLTETEAQAKGIEYEKAAFPWAASGRSLSIGRNEGLTKVIYDKATKQVLGAGMTGTNAGELIAEAVLALEMGADLTDIGLTVHPHPTLSETFCFAAEMGEGTITDLLPPKK